MRPMCSPRCCGIAWRGPSVPAWYQTRSTTRRPPETSVTLAVVAATFESMAVPQLAWQPSLIDLSSTLGVDSAFGSVTRVDLEPACWVDHAGGWVSGSDGLFALLLDTVEWGQRSRWM